MSGSPQELDDPIAGCVLVGVAMTSTGAYLQEDFYAKSETESICMCCYQTVRGDHFIPLEQAQELHSIACLMRPVSLVSFERHR